MKRFFIIIMLLFAFLYSKEIVITKYLQNKPAIIVNFQGPNEIEKILKMDFTVLDHFKVFYNDVNKSDMKNFMDFNFSYSLKDKQLTVKYIKNSNIIDIKSYKSNTFAYFPFLIHQAVYDINKYFQMPSAKFLIRKVIYSLLIAPKEANIYLSDYTLSYKKLLISGGLNIFPKWANSKQTAIYFTKMENLPVLYKFNIYTGKMTKILSTQGMLAVSDVKNGQILLTLAPKALPDVYLYKNHKLIQITQYPGINVDGKFWGKNSIAFISDRLGTPYVFSKNLKTGEISKVLYQGKNQVGVDTYDNKMVISMRETSNAFGNNTFNLFLVNKNNESLKRLTFKGQNMNPRFSVDGTSIMFIKREHFFSKIGIIRLNENKIFYYNLPKILQSFDW